jgi:murein L,D-transpeptidase YcbB/YkuD
MKKYLLIFLLLAFIGCKKDKPDHLPPAKVAKVPKFKKEVKGLAIDSVAFMEEQDSVLADFYRMNDFETVWNQPEIRKAIIFMLSKTAEEEGLNPNDYYAKKLAVYENNKQLLSTDKKIAYDILLTKAVRKYLRHLARGKTSPLAVYRTWDLKRNAFNTNMLLSAGISGDSLSAVIEMARPSHVVYKKLLTALNIINSFPEEKNVKTFDTLLKIRRSDTADCMADIKRKLIYWKDLQPQDSLSNIYDRKTWAAMKKFQQRHGLVPDGVIAKGTIKELNYSRDQRKGQILANLERWRWFPHDFGKHYMLLNIPAYTLEVVKDGDTIEQKRIVVGKSVRKSPVLSSTFSNIILNPTWTVPPTIIERDLTPSATKDRGYFASKNITVYRNGKVVKPEDWIPGKAKSYRYVQKPGDDNSLGNVKFNFPSRFMVYLHDTNHRDLFVMHTRSYSSGCIRVENPLPLAVYMLNDSIRWPMDSIKKVVDTKKTTSVTLKEKINIHQLYWTAWSEDGKLIFRPDIYDWDTRLAEALRK